MLSRMTSTPRAVGLGRDALDEVLVAVVDRDVGAELAAELELALRAGGGEDPRAAAVRELDRHRADAARPAVDEQLLARLQPAGVGAEHHRPHRAGDLGQRGRVDEVDRRPARACSCPTGTATCSAYPPPASSAHTSSPTLQPATAVAERGDRARALHAEVRRRARRRRVVALPLQQVGPVQRRPPRPATSTSPAPASGSGTSWTSRTSGPPGSVMTTARMNSTVLPLRRSGRPVVCRSRRRDVALAGHDARPATADCRPHAAHRRRHRPADRARRRRRRPPRRRRRARPTTRWPRSPRPRPSSRRWPTTSSRTTASRPASARWPPSTSRPSSAPLLQRSLIRSHAAGTGPEVEREVVRALMLLRLSTLATGRTGVRPRPRRRLRRAARRRHHAGRARVRLARLLGRPRAAGARRAGADGRGRRSATPTGALRPGRRGAGRGSASNRSCWPRRRAWRSSTAPTACSASCCSPAPTSTCCCAPPTSPRR